MFGPGGAGTGMALSPDGRTLATAEMEFQQGKLSAYIRLVDLDAGKEIRRIAGTAGGVTGLAYSPSGKILAHGSSNAILLRDAATDKEVRKIKAPAGVSTLAFTSDGGTLAAYGRDQIIRLFETASGKEVRQFGEGMNLAGGGNAVVFTTFGGGAAQEFAFSPDGKTLVEGVGQVVRFWDVGSGKEVAQAAGHRGPVLTVGVAPDGKALASYGADHVVRRWDGATGKELGRFAAPPGTQNAAFAPDGRTVALAVGDTIRLHDTATGKELHQLKGHTNGTVALAFAPSGKVLASRGNADLRLHDAVKGTELRHINLPVEKVAMNPGGIRGGAFVGGRALAFSPDGQTLAVHLATTPQFVRIGNPPQPAVPDTLRLWDVATGKEVRKITLPRAGTTSLAYSPDGRVLATEHADQTISLWEIASGKERAVWAARSPGRNLGQRRSSPSAVAASAPLAGRRRTRRP